MAKSKVGATALFGVFGELAAKGAVDRAFLTVHRKDGAAACFQVDKISPQAVRGERIGGLLVQVGVPFLTAPMYFQRAPPPLLQWLTEIAEAYGAP